MLIAGTSDEDGKPIETDCAHQAGSGKQGLQHGTSSLNHSHLLDAVTIVTAVAIVTHVHVINNRLLCYIIVVLVAL